MTALTEDDRIAAMAWVDGELPPADHAAFEARLAQEPALAQAVARERTLRASLQSAYAGELDEPVPGGLLDLLAMPEPATVAANDVLPVGTNDTHRAALPHARRWAWPQFAAMAACLVLGVALGTRVLAPRSSTSGDTLALNVANDGSITAQGHLRDALEQRVAGTDLDPNSNVAVGLTFRNHAQQYCRTFTLDNASSGIACRQADGWVVADLERATSVPASAVGAYRTAGSAFSPTLLQAIDSLRDGDTLDAAGEAAAKAKGWKP